MDYTAIIGAVITIITAVITTFLIPWLKEKYGSEKLAKWQKYVDIAVEAADQIYSATQGAEKKAYVVAYLNKIGIKFDADTVDKMIESAVLLLHSSINTESSASAEKPAEPSEVEQNAEAPAVCNEATEEAGLAE